MISHSRYKLGVDIGGTFTDFTLIDMTNNNISNLKVSTVPHHPEEGIRNGLCQLIQRGILEPANIDYFVHGMTIGLNTLLQRKGSKIALFVTQGFRDILTMQRMKLPMSFDFHSKLPDPLVPRQLVFDIPERLDNLGNELIPLDLQALENATIKARALGVEGIAICFLHSYAYASHEQQAADYIRKQYPHLKICLSSELWPEIREYERACITVINLYIQKNVENYFNNLQQIICDEHIETEPFITQSNGGIMNLDSASKAPVKTLFSGPAGGVMGAIQEARFAGKENLLTLDMGGTSTDVSIVLQSEPMYSHKCQISNFPVMIPAIDVRTVGAGGGSIAWADAGGLLRVGPVSAGSDPGPACYGKATDMTVTDAYLLCGYINPNRFAGGNFILDKTKSEKAVIGLAEQFHKSSVQLADQIIQIAVSNMYVEISNILEEKGIDPRELTIVAYGGGGPLIANFVAEEIHAKDILISHSPGTLCAQGALSADFTYDAISPCHTRINGTTMDEIRFKFSELHTEAEQWLSNQKINVVDKNEIIFQNFFDARYCGQSYELQVPTNDDLLCGENVNLLQEAFHHIHQQQYGHSEPQNEVEIINLRTRIIACMPKIGHINRQHDILKQHSKKQRKTFIKGKSYKADIYEREQIKPGDIFVGPAIIEQDDTTILILPEWRGFCESDGNILICRGEGGLEYEDRSDHFRNFA